MKIKLFGAALILLVSTDACHSRRESAIEKPPMVSGAQIETVKSSSLPNYYEAVGTVRAKTSTIISSKVVGNIVALHAHEGEMIRAGQVLVEIDNREAKTQVQKAQAGLREAQTSIDEVDKNMRAAEAGKVAAEANKSLAAATLKRYQALLDRKSVSPQEFDEVQAKYKIAAAEVERAEKMLQMLSATKNMVFAKIDQAKADVSGAQIYAGYSRIYSPINGIVISKQAGVGSLAAPGTPILTIEDRIYRLDAAIQESQIRNIHLGSAAMVFVDALGQDEMTGHVVEIIPAADPASRSYTVKIELPAKQLFRSGLFGKARFSAGDRSSISIPSQAVVQRGQLNSVYVIDEAGFARMRLITIGKSFGDRVEILSGLNEGERIVVNQSIINREGVKVQ